MGLPSLDEYRANPCRVASLPWWKLPRWVATTPHPPVNEKDSVPTEWARWDRYFRLRHTLELIPDAPIPPGFTVRQLDPEADVATIVDSIANAYDTIRVAPAHVAEWTHTPVFDPTLWLAIDDAAGECAAVGIADLDPNVPEAALEWIQVSAKHRRQGLGLTLVTALLQRCQGRVDCVTVSGDCANETAPEALYRRAGFTGDDVWCVRTDT